MHVTGEARIYFATIIS